MGVLRAFLGILLVLLVAALVAAWLVPPRLDLNGYRAGIAAAATARLGRSIRIDGPIELQLLPEPMLTATDVSIGTGEDIRVTATELRLRVALWPLAEGRIDARELVLRGADMQLPWPLDPAALIVRTPRWLAALSARVEDGKLRIGGLSFTGIDATLTTGSYTGTYAAAGTAQFSGQAWTFTARLSQPGLDGSAALDVTLDGQGPVQGTGGTLTGQIGPDGALAGRVTGRGPDLSHLLPAPAVSFRAEGRLTVAGGLAAADDLAMEIGGSPAQGAVALRVSPKPRLDVALAASRLDLDAWLPVLARTATLELPTGVDLSAEAATLAGGTLRGLRAAVDLSTAGAELREARAVLPGDAPMRLSGRITPVDAGGQRRARFEGDVAVTAPALRTTLAWLEQAGAIPVGALPDGVLRTADLSAHVVTDPGQVAVGPLDGMVDGSHVTGSLTLRAGKRFALGAGLAVDRLDLDPWLPAGVPSLPSLPARFAPFDVDVRLEAKQALLHGITVSPLSVDAGAEGGRLTLRKLDFQVNGVHGNASATVADGGVVSEGRLDLQAPQAEPLAALLPDSLSFLGHRTPRLWRAAANVQVLGEGAPGKLGLKITADLADLRLEAQPVLDLPRHTWSGTMTLRHPGAPRLAEALGVAGAAAWLGDGSLGVIAKLSGDPAKLAVENFEMTAGSLHATGALLLERGAVARLTGTIDAETLPLPLPYPRALDPLPIPSLAGLELSVKLRAGQVLAGLSPVIDHAETTLGVSRGVLLIDGLTAKLGGGGLTGHAAFDTAAEPPRLAATCAVSGATISGPVFDLPLDLTAGRLDATVGVSAAGHSPAALLSTLTGDVRISVQDGTLSGVSIARIGADLAEDAVRAALAGGDTPFRSLDLQARIDRGVVTLPTVRMAAASGSASLTGAIDLPGASADLRLAIRPAVPDPPEIGLRLTGPLEQLARTPELADATRWRAAHAAADPPP
jgi:uncharacterized protein involved in outer membrane biogenesis